MQTIPDDRGERWNVLRQFIDHWYRPIGSTPSDGYSSEQLDAAQKSLGVKLPSALREFYKLAGKRQDVWSVQDELLAPDKLLRKDGNLIFYVENQNVVTWAVRESDLEQEDPPVFVVSNMVPDGMIMESNSLSKFFIQLAVYCLKWSPDNQFWITGFASDEIFSILDKNFDPFPFKEWFWGNGRFHGHADLVIETDTKENYINVIGRDLAVMKELVNLLGSSVSWECWSPECGFVQK